MTFRTYTFFIAQVHPWALLDQQIAT